MRDLKITVPDALMGLFIHIYNSGYKAGHHETVEGGYVDIHSVDMENYHNETVKELVYHLIGGEYE